MSNSFGKFKIEEAIYLLEKNLYDSNESTWPLVLPLIETLIIEATSCTRI